MTLTPQPSTLPTINSPPALPECYFSPSGGCQAALIDAIEAALKTIQVQAYEFTNSILGSALAAAQRRGVSVSVTLDPLNLEQKKSVMKSLQMSGITIRIDHMHNIAHNKIVIVDGNVLFTGSYNFTESAEFNNAENLLAVHDPATVAAYTANWWRHWLHSTPPEAPAPPSTPPAINSPPPMPSGVG